MRSPPSVRSTKAGREAPGGVLSLAPPNLVEKLPVAAGGRHGGRSIGGFVETRFVDFVTLEGGVTLPSHLERVLDGRWVQQVRLEDVEVDPEIAAADFDPARLAGFAAASLTSRHQSWYALMNADHSDSRQ